MRYFIRNIILIPLWGLLNLPVNALSLADSVINIHEVEITANRNLKDKALVQTTIDSLVIKENVSGSMAELLSNHTSVFIKTYGQGALATASFRGTGASHTKVEWNGIPINNPMLGQVDFSLIPVYFIDNISILHGGSSLHEGSGALGGSIHLMSELRNDKPLYGTFIQGVGSFDTYKSFITLGGNYKKAQMAVRYLNESSQNDFIYFNNANGLWNKEKQLNADYQKQAVSVDLSYNGGKMGVFAMDGWMQLSHRNLPAIMSYQGTGRDEYQQDSETRWIGKWSKQWRNIKGNFISGYSQTNMDYYLANKTPFGVLLNYDSKSIAESFYQKIDVEYRCNQKLLFRWLMNYNNHQVRIFDEKKQTGYNAYRDELGSSVSIHFQPYQRVLFSGLLRQDWVDDQFSPWMPSLAMELDIFKKKQLVFMSSVTRNYHQPTLNDLYWLPGGNPNLKPEEGYTADIGLKNQWKSASIGITNSIQGYASYINDWIIWRPSEFRFWQADNIQKVFVRGLDYNASIKYLHSKWNVEWKGGYSLTKTTNEQDDINGSSSKGKQLIYIPVHKANMMTTWAYSNIYLNYIYTFTGERFTTSSNEKTRHQLPSYDLHNIALGYKFVAFQTSADVQFKIYNLFNVDYQAILWRAMPERNFMILLKLSF